MLFELSRDKSMKVAYADNKDSYLTGHLSNMITAFLSACSKSGYDPLIPMERIAKFLIRIVR